MREVVHPAAWPVPAGYSNAIRLSDYRELLAIAGQVGRRPDGTIVEGATEQAKQAVDNLLAVLAAAGMTAGDLLHWTLYIVEGTDLQSVYRGLRGLGSADPAAATLVFVKGLVAPELLLEIQAFAGK